MAYLVGTAERDVLSGTEDGDTLVGLAGNDELNGLGGRDDLNGGEGSDILRGGEGDDTLRDGSDPSTAAADNDQLFGEGGNDFLNYYVTTAGADTVLLDGGLDDDQIRFHSWYYTQAVSVLGGDGNDDIDLIGGGSIHVDAGAGADRIAFNLSDHSTSYALTLGSGSDLVQIRTHDTSSRGPVVRITDIETGAAGDRISIDNYLQRLSNWDRDSNPFASGHLALVQRGADAVLMIDFDGGANGFRDLIIYEGVTREALTHHNLGYAPDGAITPAIQLDGTGGSDLLLGSGGDDVLRGQDGHDQIYGGGGDDRLEGGFGDDTLNGEFGDDLLLAGEGRDNLSDHSGGSDKLHGEDGPDTITVSRSGPQSAPGNILIDGGAGDDQLHFYGDTRLRGHVDALTFVGGAGRDYIIVISAASATIDAGEDADSVNIYHIGTNYLITLGGGEDKLELVGGKDLGGEIVVTDFQTGAGGDRLALARYLEGALAGWDPRSNPFDGGFLRLVQQGADALLQMDRDGPSGAGAFATLITFRNVASTSFIGHNTGFLTLRGTEGDDRLEGDGAANFISGLGGNDVLIGAGGDDTMEGGSGNDSLDGGSGKDRLDGGAGADVLIGGGDDDLYVNVGEGDTVTESTTDPRGGKDEVQTALSSYTVPAGVEVLVGTSNAGQILRGTDADDVIRGADGPDFIYLYGGFNQASGGAGDDRIEGGSGIDSLYGGPGSDTILGGDGDDFLYGGHPFMSGGGNDRIEGGAGNDELEGDVGSDVLIGGTGNDVLEDSKSGEDLLDGGDGDDTFSVFRYSNAAALPVSMLGGAGNDKFALGIYNSSTVTISAGDGNDVIMFYGHNGTANVTLGAGQDVVSFSDYYPTFDPAGRIVVTDFSVGVGGDRIGWTGFLKGWLTNWDGSTNPFATGHARLVQSGTSVLLQLDRDGGADAFATRVEFQNSNVSGFTAANLEYAPLVNGTAGADNLIGTAGDDAFSGGGGADLFRLEQGGNDLALGGEGNDGFYFGAALTAADQVDGGEGTLDQIAIQGSYAGLTFGANNLVGIEQLVLLPGSDARFGDTSGSLYSYSLTTVDANVAAGRQLVVTFNTLRAGENVTFNGSAETDGTFLTYGGFGTDILTGGQKNDGFFFGTGRFGAGDKVDGQGGNVDQLGLQGHYSGANGIVFGADQLKNIEFIVALTGSDARFGSSGASFSYDLTSHDGNVAAGRTMIVSANTLKTHETLTFNGSAETDGRFQIFSGNGADVLTGGAGADEIVGLGGDDRIAGGLGGDKLTGGDGADTFVYASAAESTSLGFDTLAGFDYRVDRIDLPGAVTGFTGKIETGALNGVSFDADLAAAVDGALQANSAVIFRPDAGDYAGREFAIVDANGDGVYTAGQDYLFEVVEPEIPIDPVHDFFI
jgi:Ca2+-binding RTX toxin-like protein